MYCIDIEGIGMNALSRYFKSKGYKVSGYDKTPSGLTGQFDITMKKADVERADWILMSSINVILSRRGISLHIKHINDKSMVFRKALILDKDFGVCGENAIFVMVKHLPINNAMISRSIPINLADKLLNDPQFENEFVSMPTLIKFVKIWLTTNKRPKDDYSVSETCRTCYEIVKWNAGLPETDSRKKNLSDSTFWKSLEKLLETYCDTWLSEDEGRAYQQALLTAKYEKDFPKKVKWKIETFCNDRRNWLGLAKNDDIIKDMYQRVCIVLYEDDKKVIKAISQPGALWGYLQTIVKNLFNPAIPKLFFTESFIRNRKKKKGEKIACSYAHLSLYSWSPSELEGILLGEQLYDKRVCPLLRSLIEKYYKPWEENSPGGNIGKYNNDIKDQLRVLFDSIREEREKENKSFPLYSVGLSYDCTAHQSYQRTTEPSSALREIYTPGEELPPDPKPDDGPEPAPDWISYTPLSNTQALGILDEIFSQNDDSEVVRVYRIACYFETRLYKAGRDSDLSKRYAYKLEDLKVFSSECERGSKSYMKNWTIANDKTEEEYTKGAKKAIKENRINNEELFSVIKFFRNCDFIDLYNKEKNTHYDHI